MYMRVTQRAIGGRISKRTRAFSLQASSSLEAPFSEKEVRDVVFQMGCLKSPGPNDFLKNGIVNRRCNKTYVCLIPKKKEVAHVNDFRPGRQILDTILTASKVIDEWALKGRKGVLLKLNLEKGYDEVDWSSLDMAVKLKGFGRRWRRWICGFLSMTNFSIIVNGDLTYLQYMEDTLLFSSWENCNLETWWKVINLFLLGVGLSLDISKKSLIGINLDNADLAPYAST
ncbi:hypothetical protein E5676_scaffold1737G001060 [Cucumis melo var. makuwa]|uniref:Reverse transcriptase domain-containing protein n=1 Tax=Cucumis melo var. makuwa TaxID=1194695 RepID=A0A5D3C943_CUCMM|nr:hypothetical protein E5676_scaffold1737G001060 [Cucumis melo var. makuwa]